MNEIAKLYFQWPTGEDDTIVLEASNVEEMNYLVDSELSKRKAEFTGIECIQRCND